MGWRVAEGVELWLGGGAGGVCAGVAAFCLEAKVTVGFADIAHEVEVAAVDEDIDAPVAVPIGHGEFTAAAGPGAFFV